MPFVDSAETAGRHYDLVVVGSGFGSLFFLHKWLEHSKGRALIVEWGDRHDHAWQVENRRSTTIAPDQTYASKSEKPWNFTVGLGGGTNCWFAQTPRFHPNDFKLRSLYGVGADWPIAYDDLEPYYAQAEQIMSVAGDPDMAKVMPRSTPFPQPPHRLTSVDEIMKARQPDRHFAMPTARARVATPDRSACCASFRCSQCPVDAKFTAANGFKTLLADPRVSIALRTKAVRFDSGPNAVSGLVVEHASREHRVTGDLFVLGANAIHSPALLLRSGMESSLTGKGLHESYGTFVEADLDGLDNFDGGTITTGINYGLYDGPFRARHAGALVYFENRFPFGLRPEPGRWRQILPMMIVTEDPPDDRNAVAIDGKGDPVITFVGVSDYARRGQKAAFDALPDLLAPLPVEAIHFREERPTESHLQGTLRMGADPATSVIDPRMVHHRWRNLVVVGTASFATCSCANPSLTAAALSLRAADLLA